MTASDFENEVTYRMTLSIFKHFFENGWLTKKEFALLDRQLVEKYRPIIGGL